MNRAGLLVVATLIAFGLVGAAPSPAQSQAHPTAPKASDPEFMSFVYDVVSVKPLKPTGGGRGGGGGGCGGLPLFNGGPLSAQSPDGFTAKGVSLHELILSAYGVKPWFLQGNPSWLDSACYDIDA